MNASHYSLGVIIWGTIAILYFTGGLSWSTGLMMDTPYSLTLVILSSIVVYTWPRPILQTYSDAPIGRFRRYGDILPPQSIL